MTTCAVTFYAGAAEAAGTQTATVELADGSTTADLIAHLGAHNERLAAVLDMCTLLLDGTAAAPGDPLPHSTKVDVLPPFAGG